MYFYQYVVATGLVFMGAPALASGEDTFKAVCANCHAKAFANSPQIGDNNKWAPLVAEGQVIITAHGFVGVRAMPPKGGVPDLTVQGFSEAVNYMVNQSGGTWKQPDKKMMAAIQAEIAQRQKLSTVK
ncbi:c-type cytochrome [Limnohabitans sp.]|uniref:c-type cytochrome n=1 Tax=Limnohabitans sp. TaxID=1907725 RepID=UPI002FDC87B4